MSESELSPPKKYLDVLRKYFGHETFKPLQWKIIKSLLEDKRDNCAVMATGYGKSLCYQFPSVYTRGVTIVVSPLVSLMEDQVSNMTCTNVNACLLGTAQAEKGATVERILEGQYSLVYITPELAAGGYGLDLFEKMQEVLSITLIAIDEAHCISTWGNDFRTTYKQLGSLRTYFPSTPILAVTATATKSVLNDIIKLLKMRDPQIVSATYDRPNLYLEVYHRDKSSIIEDLKPILNKENGMWTMQSKTIIYCLTRQQVENVAQSLTAVGIECVFYHAGRSIKMRKTVQQQFIDGSVSVIIATNAFGMGIDRPDVRCIVHFGTPKDVESYYQEIGRAGRDGQPARCVLLYSGEDANTQKNIREASSYTTLTYVKRREAAYTKMEQFLRTNRCRWDFILDFFEQKEPKTPRETCCDVCTSKSMNIKYDEIYEGLDQDGNYDFSRDFGLYLNAMEALEGRYGNLIYKMFLRGGRNTRVEKYNKHPLFGAGRNKSDDWWKTIASLLQMEGYVDKKSVNLGPIKVTTLHVNENGQDLIRNLETNPQSTKVLLKAPSEILKLLKHKVHLETPGSVTRERGLQDKLLEKRLMETRKSIANRLDCVPHTVLPEVSIIRLVYKKPLNLKDLDDLKLGGMVENRLSTLGMEFLRVIRESQGLDPEIGENKTKPIKEALAEHPLENCAVTHTGELTFSMYVKGSKLDEIMSIRHLPRSSIVTHFIDFIRDGRQVKIKDLGVKLEEVQEVLEAIKAGNTQLKDLRTACLKIPYDTVRLIFACYEVRNHLHKLGIKYEEFEEFPLFVETETKSEDVPNEKVSVPSQNNSQTYSQAKELNEVKNSVSTRVIDEVEQSTWDDIERSTQPLYFPRKKETEVTSSAKPSRGWFKYSKKKTNQLRHTSPEKCTASAADGNLNDLLDEIDRQTKENHFITEEHGLTEKTLKDKHEHAEKQTFSSVLESDNCDNLENTQDNSNEDTTILVKIPKSSSHIVEISLLNHEQTRSSAPITLDAARSSETDIISNKVCLNVKLLSSNEDGQLISIKASVFDKKTEALKRKCTNATQFEDPNKRQKM